MERYTFSDIFKYLEDNKIELNETDLAYKTFNVYFDNNSNEFKFKTNSAPINSLYSKYNAFTLISNNHIITINNDHKIISVYVKQSSKNNESDNSTIINALIGKLSSYEFIFNDSKKTFFIQYIEPKLLDKVVSRLQQSFPQIFDIYISKMISFMCKLFNDSGRGDIGKLKNGKYLKFISNLVFENNRYNMEWFKFTTCSVSLSLIYSQKMYNLNISKTSDDYDYLVYVSSDKTIMEEIYLNEITAIDTNIIAIYLECKETDIERCSELVKHKLSLRQNHNNCLQ